MTTTTPTTKLEPIYLLYDERMLEHRPVGWIEPEIYPEYLDDIPDDYPMENPERLRVIFNRLGQLDKRLMQIIMRDTNTDLSHGGGVIYKRLTCDMATREQILLAHSEAFYERMEQLEFYTDTELAAISEKVRHDIYYSRESFRAARVAAGGLLACVDAVCDDNKDPSNSTNKALALVRPPGHHACQEQEMGFCFVNSVVVAAKYAIHTNRAKRIVILDWDVHDGNGTAESTINDENIFRIDLHRYDPRGGFYPRTGPAHEIGSGKAKGLNLNVGWTMGGMRNSDYAAAFYELILPLLVDYKPDLLIISCGLDAAMGDLLGGCELTPGFFHAMTRASIEAVGPNTPVVCALEGGYAMNVIPDCMEAVTLAMLNCPFSYHSSASSYCSGGAPLAESTRWPLLDPLERSRRALSKYYVREAAFMLLYSAAADINTSIKIFQGIPRWKNVTLKRIIGVTKPRPQPSNKRKTTASQEVDRPFQRPRIYLWYGTEEWHHRHYQLVWY